MRLKEVPPPFACLLALIVLFGVDAASTVPLEINHQGVVKVGGSPFDGTGEFSFAILDPDTDNNLWTNDGSNLGGSEAPDRAVSLSVDIGLYSVRLGHDGLDNMTPIPPAVFEDDNRALRVWFDDGENGVSQLSPDHALTSAPYAFRTDSALNGVPSGFSILSETPEAPPGFTATGLPVEAGDVWVGRPPMPTKRQGHAVGVVDGKIYVIGGFDDSKAFVGTNEEYDPATNTWRERAPMPTARGNFAIGVVNHKLYAIGGNVSPFTINEEYIPISNTWSTKAPMMNGRQDLAVGVVNDKIYAIGGGFGGGVGNKTEEYDPATNMWTPKADMPTRRLSPAIGVVRVRPFVIGPIKDSEKGVLQGPRDVLLVMGGLDGDVFPTDIHEQYDPSNDMWTTRTPMLAPRSGHKVGVVGNKAYAIGGIDENYNRVGLNEVYDPSSQTWQTKESLPTLRTGFGLGVIGNKIFVIGGITPSLDRLAINEEYTSSEILYVHRKE